MTGSSISPPRPATIQPGRRIRGVVEHAVVPVSEQRTLAEETTYKAAVAMMGKDANRWAPGTHETADHSMPFCVASALRDGEFNDHTFSSERLHDPAMLTLMAKVKVAEEPRHTARYPEAAPSSVRVRMKGGATVEKEVIYPKGHAKAPMSEAEVIAKFNTMTSGRVDAGRRSQVIDCVLRFDKAGDVSGLLALLAN